MSLLIRRARSGEAGLVLSFVRELAEYEKLLHEMEATEADIDTALPTADVVVAATASSIPIVGKGMTERALKKRKHRPMFMVDIAVPRDIEPEVGSLADVYLYTIDDLEQVIQEGVSSRQQAAAQADQIIDVQVERFMGWLREEAPAYYLVRLVAYGLILVAILEKNHLGRKKQ